MADRIPSDAPNPAPVLVVGSVAFDNAITPYGQKEHILGGQILLFVRGELLPKSAWSA